MKLACFSGAGTNETQRNWKDKWGQVGVEQRSIHASQSPQHDESCLVGEVLLQRSRLSDFNLSSAETFNSEGQLQTKAVNRAEGWWSSLMNWGIYFEDI